MGIALEDVRLASSRGANVKAPRANRTPLYVKGPTWSIPKRWATKAKPQIAAVINSKTSD
jgi:hypothetical protein